MRVEQLYPLPTEQMFQILERYPNATELRLAAGGARRTWVRGTSSRAASTRRTRTPTRSGA
ncbi:MAG: hypothetical protein U5R31_13005 [Acidimicrobiia bacterium]|nr:hypothetical protein [Acidimicrobiia bacterium]